jgi:hypothetical protein
VTDNDRSKTTGELNISAEDGNRVGPRNVETPHLEAAI